MFLATTPRSEFPHLLFIGLSRDNIHRLHDDRPIHITQGHHGAVLPPDWEIVIVSGETEQSILERLKSQRIIIRTE